MALFEKTPAGAAKTALISAQALVDRAAAAVKQFTDKRMTAVERHEAALAAAAEVDASLKNADVEAVAAVASGRELPNLASLYTRRDQAALKVRATAALVEKCDAELLAARDELDDATEAQARAVRGDTLARLAKALEAAKAIDDELITQGGGFDIGIMIEQAQAAAEKCVQPVLRDIGIYRESANGMGDLTRSAPPDVAVREVASGNWEFSNSRDARRYATEVEALRAETAADKQRAKPRVAEGANV